MSPDRRLLPLLDKVKSAGTNKWVACCPAHDDRSPSLSIKQVEDGRLLIKCWSGCGASDVLDAIGLTFSDLYPDTSKRDFKSLQPRERWIPRDSLTALSVDIWLIVVAAAAVHAGQILKDDERERLMTAANNVWAAFREVNL